MKFFSTKHQSPELGFVAATIRGLADDGGLYMPEKFPRLTEQTLQSFSKRSFQEIAFAVAEPFLSEDFDKATICNIVESSANFDVPLREITENATALELFHGPTLAFKDFGARFLAQVLAHGAAQEREVVILVATSGDTGSAVAHGFHNVPGVRVVVLYPSGKVSTLQEQQLCTLGGNITALEVSGVFDDCQRLVKEAFLDGDLREKLQLCSANSINIARLVPQSFYYFYAASRRKHPDLPLVFSVPSGNFGNLTAGLFAEQLGLSVQRFVASTNSNSVVPEYLQSGIFSPRPSIATISNAMDVGNPSNFARMLELFGNDVTRMQQRIVGYHFSDEETRAAMRRMYSELQYIADPHGAVAFLGLEQYVRDFGPCDGIFLETAHPAKFQDVVKDALGIETPLPPALAEAFTKKKLSLPLDTKFASLKDFLMEL